MSDPGRGPDIIWILDNLASIAPHLAVALLLVAILSLVRRAPRMAFLCGLAALVPASLVVRSVVEAAPVAHCRDAGPRLRVVTFNLLNDSVDRTAAVEWLGSLDADVIAVQESHDVWERDLEPLRGTHPHVQHSPSGNTAVYSRLPLAFGPATSVIPLFPRGLGVRLDHEGDVVTILAVHVRKVLHASHRRQRLQELKRIGEQVRQAPGPVIVLGDFNAGPTSLDFSAFLTEAGLRSPGLTVPPIATWPSRLPGLGIQIDHVLTTPGIGFEDVWAGPRRGSNHLPVVADLALGGCG